MINQPHAKHVLHFGICQKQFKANKSKRLKNEASTLTPGMQVTSTFFSEMTGGQLTSALDVGGPLTTFNFHLRTPQNSNWIISKQVRQILMTSNLLFFVGGLDTKWKCDS